MELPPEIWEHILSIVCINHAFSRTDLREASLVCRIFRDICQRFLFQNLTLSPMIGVDYKGRGSSGTVRAANSQGKPAELEAWGWDAWEKDLHRTIRSDRRLDIIAKHSSLSSQLRNLTIRGYGLRWYRYPSDPFAVPERKALSKAVFDAFLGLRRTLSEHLHHFTQLRHLELGQYPVDVELLTAINSHPTLKELKLNFCWYPVSTAPLTSITSMSVGHIPTTYGLTWVPPTTSPYAHIPDHHISSAYELISPEAVEQLDFTFGSYESDVRHLLEHLSARMSRGQFHSLRKMKLRSSYYPPETPKLLRQLFAHTPILRELHITQSSPRSCALEDALPSPYMPKLEILSCPLEWARFLVPGRPVSDIRVWVVEEDASPDFLASTDLELDKLLRPLTLSTVPISTLHLPEYPPLAPVWLLMPYIATTFPAILDLRVAVAGEEMNIRQIWRCGTRNGVPVPCIDTTGEMIEGDLIERLTEDVQGAVEADLVGGEKVVLPPIAERILAHRGITEDIVEQSKDSLPLAPRLGVRRGPGGIVAPPTEDYSRRTASRPTTPIQDIEEPPLAPLQTFFDDLDERGIPTSKPEMHLDVLIFIARGHYPLPPALQSLSVVSCFGTSARWSLFEGIDHYELCVRTALDDISQRNTELCLYKFADDDDYGTGPYRRLERRRKDGFDTGTDTSDTMWERRGDPW